MLVLLLGPSGVGKTSIIREIVHKFGWSPVMSYVTRPSRGDDFKIHISHADIAYLAEYGKLWSDVPHLGHRYSTLRAEITLALQDRDIFYVLDFSLAHRLEFFASAPHLPIIVVPESLEALERRLISAGREDRVSTAREEMRAIQEMRGAPLMERELRFVVNQTEELDATVSTIRRYAEVWAKRVVQT